MLHFAAHFHVLGHIQLTPYRQHTRHAIQVYTPSPIFRFSTKFTVHFMRGQRAVFCRSVRVFQVARDAICALILGAPPGKVYNQMRNVARRMNERF